MSKVIVEMERACLQECDELRTELAEAHAEITAVRAALDQERADNERLRSIAHAADVFVRVEDSTARTMSEWQLAFDLLRTALLSGRGEVRRNDPVAEEIAALDRQWQKQIDIRRGGNDE